MMKRILLLAVLLLQCMVINADTWNYLGKGEWTDPVWTSGNSPMKETVDVEESWENPGVFRITIEDGCQPIVYTQDPNKVYVTKYTMKNSAGSNLTVSQNCKENGWSGTSYYGSISDGL